MEIRSFLDVFRWTSQVTFNPVMAVIAEEYFVLQHAEKQLVNRFYDGEARDFNYQVVYGGETTGAEVAALAASYPMMAERRVVIVREAEKLSKEKESLTGYLKQPSSTTLLLFSATKLNRASNPWKALPKAFIAEQPPVYENHIREWIPSLAKSYQLTIGEDVLEFIIQTMGTSVSMIAAEFEKISMAEIPGRKLTVDVVSRLTGIRREWNPWELKDAIMRGDEARAQMIAIKMLQSGENAVGIVAGLAVSLKSMWMKSYQLATEKNLPAPQRYPEKIELEQVKALGPKAARKLEYFIEKLAELDAGLKGFSPLPPDILFCTWISDICNFERREE